MLRDRYAITAKPVDLDQGGEDACEDEEEQGTGR
jgi:hypothetical protein